MSRVWCRSGWSRWSWTRRGSCGGAPGGEGKTFRAYDPDQVLLMAPGCRIGFRMGISRGSSLIWWSRGAGSSAIYDSYEEERGFPPYDPRLMVKLLVYGYANGTMSSRKLERARSDVAVRMLCADQHPDYRSIARFRKRHLEALGELFVQALRLCREAGLRAWGPRVGWHEVARERFAS